MAVRLRLLIFAALTTFAAAGPACASGGDGPIDEFISPDRPDIDLDQYESGSLGVLLPTYSRIFLYPAWRAVLLGTDALQHEKRESGALRKACCTDVSDWVDERSPDTPQAKWLNARSGIVSVPPRMKLAMERRTTPDSWSFYRNCSDSSYLFAQATLQDLSKRPDATPERLKDWVAAQDAVFEFCGYVEGEKTYGWQHPVAPPPAIPSALPAEEAKVWRQLREYQIAAAYFYSGDNNSARERFQAIGQDASHPMHDWGEYLALRASIREATLSESEGPGPQGELEDMANHILHNPALSKVHAYVRASLRLMKARLSPEERFEELSAALNDWRKNPYADDALADWRLLANQLFDNGKAPPFEPLRSNYEFFDWMRSIQGCGNNLPDDHKTCDAEASHALEKWHEAVKARKPEAKAWLIAVLITAKRLDADVLAQAQKVPDSAPEYLTVQYYLVRNMRLNGQPDQARRVADAQLEGTIESRSALNLFLQERFALATSLEDASRYLSRSVAVYGNPDTKEMRPAQERRIGLADDGTQWLNDYLAISDLLKLANLKALPQALRTQIAVSAWVRADLLSKPQLAEQAADIAAKLQPNLASLADTYLKTKDDMERQHLLLVAGVSRTGIVPAVNWTMNFSYLPSRDEDASADMWCGLGDNDDRKSGGDLLSPNFPSVSNDAKATDEEMASLGKLGTATGYFGKHVLAYTRIHPQDPQIPWLLHVVVISTRGGCVDKDNSEMSRSAYSLLHRKYRSSEWAVKTPYWY